MNNTSIHRYLLITFVQNYEYYSMNNNKNDLTKQVGT